jgi:hypothetical protein
MPDQGVEPARGWFAGSTGGDFLSAVLDTADWRSSTEAGCFSMEMSTVIAFDANTFGRDGL